MDKRKKKIHIIFATSKTHQSLSKKHTKENYNYVLLYQILHTYSSFLLLACLDYENVLTTQILNKYFIVKMLNIHDHFQNIAQSHGMELKGSAAGSSLGTVHKSSLLDVSG